MRLKTMTCDVAVATSLISMGVASVDGLLLAVEHNRVAIVSQLLDAGVDIDAVDQLGKCACHYAIENNHVDALQLLIQRGAKVSSGQLLKAASRAQLCDDRVTILLLDAGASVDQLTRFDIIRLVALPTSFGVLTRLRARNVDLRTVRDLNGNSLCHAVVMNAECDNENLERVVRDVIDVGGADPNDIADECRRSTALHYAAAQRNATAMRILVELGADVDQRDAFGRTALHRICDEFDKNDDGSCALLLVALGTNVRLIDESGEPASFVMVQWRHVAALCACIAGGDNLDQPNITGYTLRNFAIVHDCPVPSNADVDAARRRIAKMRLDLVRVRAAQICVGLQPLALDALQLCEVMEFVWRVGFADRLSSVVEHRRHREALSPGTHLKKLSDHLMFNRKSVSPLSQLPTIGETRSPHRWRQTNASKFRTIAMH
jgi:ankyrin repeat protein